MLCLVNNHTYTNILTTYQNRVFDGETLQQLREVGDLVRCNQNGQSLSDLTGMPVKDAAVTDTLQLLKHGHLVVGGDVHTIKPIVVVSCHIGALLSVGSRCQRQQRQRQADAYEHGIVVCHEAQRNHDVCSVELFTVD